jgi:CRISPR/Cas system CSM-associated protein Csm2 small subunit
LREGKMAATTKKKRTVSKTTSKRRVKKSDVPLREVESSMDELALDDFAHTTKEELRKLGDKIHEATDKGVHMVKDIADHVQRFASDATELTKLKIELHNLKSERTKLYTLMGEQLRNLYVSKKLTNIQRRFKEDFKRLDELESAIAQIESKASGIPIAEDIKKL